MVAAAFTIYNFVACKLLPAGYCLCIDSIVFDFLTALIPAIQSCFLNSQIQDCYFLILPSGS
ncbi:hypothetical protein T4E_11903 [Trichinella pseudospiralis]|uniref:Uncharacterized protein n=1 Tax=Trichinella pseudospiralis TaxID=6337 RepID=A0A0V0XFC9_TRIPS|nr:hypothetical protein T4E_11903 [Trichinella pseudospiralis]